MEPKGDQDSKLGYILPVAALDNLPVAISIHDADYQVIYQNKKMLNTFGDVLDSKCYKRWKKDVRAQYKPCSDCPMNQTDEESPYVITRKTDLQNQNRLLKINCNPVYDNDNEIIYYIEMIKDVAEVNSPKNALYNSILLSEQIFFGFSSFANVGGDLVTSEELPWLSSHSMRSFYANLAGLWFAAIGQGHNWQTGFFGPLPALEYTHMQSMAYSFEVDSEHVRDPRFKGKDYVLLTMIMDDSLVEFFSARSRISDFLANQVAPLEHIDDINYDTLIKIKYELLKFLNLLI